MRMLREGEGTRGETGYTRLFGGGDFTKSPYNKDFTSHPKIKVFWYKNKKGESVYSTAAGAYQLMGYTWDELNGNVYNKKTKKSTYIERKDYIKKYSISDFSPKSQDELCIVLLKHKRAGLLDKLLTGFETFAIETYGSYEWASLSPGRYKNQGVHAKKEIQKARVKQLEYYDKYLAEEISGNTDLNLEENFLKKFNIKCNCKEQQEVIKNKKKGLDLNKAIIGLNRRAGASDTSVGLCAKYVRLALEDGGMTTWGKTKADQRPGSAKDYGPFLLHKGFTEIEVSNDNYQIGDIAVIESFPKNEHGHIEMYNGENWVSDFIQRTFYPGRAYRKAKPNFKIYRWK